MYTLPILALVGLFVFVLITTILRRYKRCPSDRVLVVYGKVGGGSARCIHGGAAFIWPVFQDYAFLDLKPISIDANLTNALSRQNIRVDVPCRFTIAISTEHDSMNTAAERLLGLTHAQIQELAKDILFGQLRLVHLASESGSHFSGWAIPRLLGSVSCLWLEKRPSSFRPFFAAKI